MRGVPNFVTYQDPVISALRLAGQVVTAVVLLWLWLRAGRIGWLRAAGLALLVVVFLGPVVQPWYVLWGLDLLACTRLDRRVVLVAAGGSFWLSMMIAPAGLEPVPRGRPRDRDVDRGAGGDAGRAGPVPGEQAPAAADPRSEPVPAPARAGAGGPDREEPVASLP